ncbi:MAG: hypothetical protein RML35_02805 [Chloroherpetonaceae bacterium]|nr:hypothetical protein [Chloroherpetonaceae bacterium]
MAAEISLKSLAVRKIVANGAKILNVLFSIQKKQAEHFVQYLLESKGGVSDGKTGDSNRSAEPLL